MGGCGSSNRSQYGRRQVEGCPSLDVRQWQRGGLLVEGGFNGNDQWQRPSRRVYSMWVIVESDFLTLAYDYCRDDGLSERLRYPVSLARTHCNFGGTRYWFVCPMQGCERRAAILYLVGRRFACRHCQHLAYRTQHEKAYDRGLLKAQRIRMKLGGSADMSLLFPPKPKHMHWRKYYRLVAADQRGAMRWATGLRAWLDSRK